MIDDTEGATQRFWTDVDDELRHARHHHPTPITSPHEGYAVILEEVDEFWDEVKRKEHDHRRMYGELVQIAAMAARTATDALFKAPVSLSQPLSDEDWAEARRRSESITKRLRGA